MYDERNNMMKKCLYFLVAAISFVAYSQTNEKYPRQYFISPMNIPTEPSGTFGELRTNHFHSGLDFKTKQKEGFEVYAVADGFISRIKYSTFGYGKAIYVTHPNGFTTVYAHLQKANPAIEQYVKKHQYNKQSFEIEVFPKKDELKVKKGELLAYSGNSGGSGGPHLHFEYRDTASEEIINPLFFGLDTSFKDSVSPVLRSLWAYPLTDTSAVNKSASKANLVFNKLEGNNFIANKLLAKGPIGFGINSYDMFDGHYNHNGVYKIAMFLNGSPYYIVTFDRFSFNDTRYINSYIDYEHKAVKNETIQKLFYKNKFPLSLIKDNRHDGIIDVKPGDNYSVLIKIYDFHGNQTQVTIPISYDSATPIANKNNTVTNYFLKADRENIYQKENITVTIPKNTFVEDFYLDFDVKDGILKLHKDIEPAYQNMTIEIDTENITDKNFDIKKAFIAEVSGKKPNYLTTYYKGKKLNARTKNLGTYKILIDDKAPKIYGLSFKDGDNLDDASTIKINISDDQSGIKSYAGYLNDKWILMDYDYKTNSLIHNLSDDVFINGENVFRVEVADFAGNTTKFEAKFTKTKTN